jgi:hypothetical protein
MKRIVVGTIGIIIYIASAILGQLDFNGFIALAIWLVSLVTIFWSIFQPQLFSCSFKKLHLFKEAKVSVFFLLILAIGIFFRFFQIETLPFGLWLDELAFSMRALEIMEHKIPAGLFDTSPMHRENWVVFNHLYIYFVIFIFKLVGVNYLAVKLVSLLPSVGIIIASYFLFKRVAGNTLTPIVTMFLISVSHWSTTISRWGWNEIMMSMFQVIAYYYLLKGLKNNSYQNLALAGIFLGLTFYTYMAFNIVFVILLVFLIISMLYNPSNWKDYFKKGLVVIAAAIIIIFPGSIDYIKTPSLYITRIQEVFIGHEIKAEKSIQPLLVSTARHLKMFNFKGDSNCRHNTEGLPQLDYITGLFFIIGLIISLKSINKSYHSLLFIWFLLGLLAGILSTGLSDSPHAYRTAMIIPVVMYYAALGMTSTYTLINKYMNKKVLNGLFIIVLAAITGLNYHIYFVLRPQSIHCYNANLIPEDIIVAREVKSLREKSPEIPSFIAGTLVNNPDTAIILNYISPVKKPGNEHTDYGIDNPYFGIIKVMPSGLFNFYHQTCYLLFPEEHVYIVENLYPEAKLTPLKTSFGEIFGYKTLLTVEDFNKAKQLTIERSKTTPGKRHICGAVISKGTYNAWFKASLSGILLSIDSNMVIEKPDKPESFLLNSNKILQFKIITDYPTDETMSNILVSDFDHKNFKRFADKLEVYRYNADNGLFVEYFSHPDWTGEIFKKEYARNFAPLTVNNESAKEGHSSIWKGYLEIPHSGDYYFEINTNQAVLLYLEGNLVIEIDAQTAKRENNKSLTLEQGIYKLVMKINHPAKDPDFRFLWKPSGKQNVEDINFNYLHITKHKNFCG